MTNQSDRQADARSSTSTTLTYEGDSLAYFDSQSVPAGDYNGRLLAWINQALGTSYTEINGAKTALANNISIPTWDGLNLLGRAGTSTPTTPLITGASSNTLGSMVNPASPWRSVMPFPDAATTTGDTAVLAKMFGRDGTFDLYYMGTAQRNFAALGQGVMFDLQMATYSGTGGNANGLESPNTFNPNDSTFIDQWVSIAQAAKAKYAVMLTKHQDGFCLWPTATTAHNITSSSPWYATKGFDVFGVFCSKMRAAGIYPIPYFSIADSTLGIDVPGFTVTQQKNYLQAQISELFTNYGPFKAFWVDAGYWFYGGAYTPWTNPEDLKNVIHGHDSNCLLINNTHRGIYDDTDIIEYEGAGQTVANLQNFTEGVQSMYNNQVWFYVSPKDFTANGAAAAGQAVITLTDVSNVLAHTIVTDTTTAGVIPANTSILSVNSVAKTITLSANITGGGVLNGDTIHTVPPIQSSATLIAKYNTIVGSGRGTYLPTAIPGPDGLVDSTQVAALTALGNSH